MEWPAEMDRLRNRVQELESLLESIDRHVKTAADFHARITAVLHTGRKL